MKKYPPEIQKRISHWLEGPYDEKTKKEILRLSKEDPQKLEDVFSADLAFGTGGIRAVMGIGTSRLNIYTVQKIAQGLASYLKHEKIKHPHRIAIGYDCRDNSKTFAKTCARVFAANGIEAYLFSAVRPTPLLSFACVYYHCSLGVMITASHNPPEYNGCKVYGKDGGQILPPLAAKIEKEIEQVTDLHKVQIVGEKHSLIKKIPPSLDKIYIETTLAMQTYPKENKVEGKNLKIVYSSLQGTGITLIPKALKSWGFSSVHLVKKECKMDGRFASVKSPNPEEKVALLGGSTELLRKKGDILLASDPDADRLGVVIRHKNKAVYLNGNQIACLALHHLLEGKKHIHDDTSFVKTIVTSELFREIATHYGKSCVDVLTGFKYIGEKIELWEKAGSHRFLFGAEESAGYLLGTTVRDKDAAIASCLIAETALHLKKNGKTLYDELLHIYRKFGIFREKLVTLTFDPKKMQLLRSKIPKLICDKKVVKVQDYLKKSDLPPSDVLSLTLEDHSKITFRPSGTEPKIKIYLSVQLKKFPDVKKAIVERDKYLEKLSLSIEEMFHAL
jgi:phosphomannomutase